MSKRILHKGLSVLLAVIMLLGVMPTGAFADNTHEHVHVEDHFDEVTADCSCENCTCIDCACEDGECLCDDRGETCACEDGICTDCAHGAACACDLTTVYSEKNAAAGIAEIHAAWETVPATILAWERPLDTGERWLPAREPVVIVADPMDERDEDTYCPGCKRNHDDCSWFCDDCNWCDECIANGDSGINHCYECESCQADHICGFCLDEEGYGGDWVVCWDCATGSSRHCSLCQDTHLVFGYFCESCEACGNCIADGTSEAQHCTICHACDPDYCQECTEERTDASGSYCLCMSCVEDLEMHCEVCGGCYTSGDVVRCEYSDLNICVTCCIEDGFHCDNCGEHAYDWCFASGPHNGHCQGCMYDDSGFMECVECGDVWCDYCGQGVSFDRGDYVGICENCIDEHKLWCPYCETVDLGLEWCADGGEHCVDCCEEWLCNNCGRCTEALSLEVCPDCSLCMECCLENAEAEGCSCGDYCVEGGDWNDHFCEQCGTCFDDVDQCDDCMLCVDCCEDNTECSDGMCVEDSDYEEHFCVDCGACFHDVDPCDDCITAGDILCVECCAGRTESNTNCEHGICMNSGWKWAEHYCDTHDCCYENCSDDPTIHTHSYDADDLCTICGKNKDGKPVIRQQPADNVVTVFNEKDPQYAEGKSSWPTVTFSVRAEANEGEEIYFQWYNKCDGKVSGATGSKLVVTVQPDDCFITTLNGFADINTYYCVVTNENGSVKSNEVKLIANHRYDRWVGLMDGVSTDYYIYNTDGTIADTITSIASTGHTHNCVGHNCNEYDKTEAHSYTAWEVVQEATVNHGGLLKRTCLRCGDCDYKQLPNLTVHDHEWVISLDSNNSTMHTGVCQICGKRGTTVPHTYGAWEDTVPATEDATGVRERACTECGFTESKETPKLKHTHFRYHYNEKKPGESYYAREYTYMTASGANDEYHFFRCTEVINGKQCGYIEPSTRVPHEYSRWTYNENSGMLERTCNRCGYVQQKSYASDEHTFILAGRGVVYKDGHGMKLMAAKAGTKVYVEPDGQKNTALFSGWTAYGYTDPYNGKYGYFDFSKQPEGTSKKATFSFVMPEHPVALICGTKSCYDYSVGDYDVYSQHPHERYDNIRNRWVRRYAEDPSTATAPGCNYDGHTALWYCTICGDQVKGKGGETIPATGHNYVLNESTVVAATCTSFGYSGDSVCTHCGDVIRGQRTAKLGHNYAAQSTLIRDADCIHSGIYAFVCQNPGCDKYQKDVSRSDPSLGHDWDEWQWRYLPTETQDGLMYRVCLNDEEHVQEKVIKAGTKVDGEIVTVKDITLDVTYLPRVGYNIYDSNNHRTTWFTPTLPAYLERVTASSWDVTQENKYDTVFMAGHRYMAVGYQVRTKGAYQFAPAEEMTVTVRVLGEVFDFPRDDTGMADTCYMVAEKDNFRYISFYLRLPDTYDLPLREWADDYSSVTFTFPCASRPGVGPDVVKTVKAEKVKAPDCCWMYTASVVGPDGQTYSDSRVQYHDPEYHAFVEPGCETEGMHEYWKCLNDGCGMLFVNAECTDDATREELIIAPAGHFWGEPSYEWIADDGAVTAHATCTRDASHTQTETVPVDRTVTLEPTCETAGTEDLMAVFSKMPFTTQTKTVSIPALGHDYSTPTYTWAEDNGTVTAAAVCSYDATHKVEETATTTYTVVTEPTLEKEGVGQYTAVFKNEAFAKQVKQVPIPKKAAQDYDYAVEGKHTGSNVAVTVTSQVTVQATVIVAVYKNGALLGTHIMTVALKPGETELTVSVPDGGDTCKVFLLSMEYIPLAEEWTEN